MLWPAGSDRIVPQEVRLQSERGSLPGRVCRVLAKARETTQVPLHEFMVANDQCCGSDPDSTYHLDAEPDAEPDADYFIYFILHFSLSSAN